MSPCPRQSSCQPFWQSTPLLSLAVAPQRWRHIFQRETAVTKAQSAEVPPGCAGSRALAAAIPALGLGAGQPEEEQSEGAANVPEDHLKVEELIDGDPLEVATWERFIERSIDGAIGFLPDLLYAIVIFVLFLVVARVAARILRRVLDRTSSDPALQNILLGLTRYTLLILGAIMALSQLGFQVGSLLASLGIAGLAIGLAAQDTLSNLIAGFTVLWDRPFRIGDNVTVGNTFGTVQEIGLRSTRIRTVRHLDVIIPNSDVISQEIINHTLHPSLRLDIPVGIGYGESVQQARRALLAAVEDYAAIHQEPSAQVVLVNLGASSVDLELRVWLQDPHDEQRVQWELNELVKGCMDAAGIEIPFPQRTLHLGSEALEKDLRGILGSAGSRKLTDSGPADAMGA
ncbi:MAG: mechanosensitive ion channel [Acidobacteriota bacterium]